MEPKKRSAKVAFTLEAARAEILGKVVKVGVKGTGTPFSAAAKKPKRSLYDQALRALDAEGAIYVDRSKEKAKYFSSEFAPSVGGAANKIEQLAARKHPALLTSADLKKALSKNESAMLGPAMELLETEKRLVKLLRKTSVVYAHGDSLRAMLGESVTNAQPAPSPGVVSGESIRRAYRDLARLSGFPAVEIAALQRHAGISMSTLKDWLREEHRRGRAVFSAGDWSLADEQTRAGLIEIEGRNERYLNVQLED